MLPRGGAATRKLRGGRLERERLKERLPRVPKRWAVDDGLPAARNPAACRCRTPRRAWVRCPASRSASPCRRRSACALWRWPRGCARAAQASSSREEQSRHSCS
eukprot:scaffold8886_cov125-Isochrysis_galbana.AAC.8